MTTSKWSLRLCLGIVLAVAAHAEDRKPFVWQSPVWARIEAAMGSVALDGTLKLSYLLAESDELKILGVRVAVEHRVELDAWGRVRSVWRFAGLQSSLVPEGCDKLRWQPLNGAVVRFERAKIGRALGEAGSSRWLIRESGLGEYEIRSRDGRAWRYAQGILVAAEHPALGEIRVVTRGGAIVKLQRADAMSTEMALLCSEYSDDGRIVRLQAGGNMDQIFQWDESGQLGSWRRADGVEIAFTYSQGLLAEAREVGKPIRRYTWRENPGVARGDSKWPAPVHLSSDNENDYACDLTAQGIVIRARNRATGQTTTTVFNPLRHRLEQRAEKGSYAVVFRKGTAAGSGLERIENERGEILEQYRYDERGQLTGVKRRGEPERTLNYDETGRLMALEENGGL